LENLASRSWWRECGGILGGEKAPDEGGYEGKVHGFVPFDSVNKSEQEKKRGERERRRTVDNSMYINRQARAKGRPQPKDKDPTTAGSQST
jgi:hypothetical protein